MHMRVHAFVRVCVRVYVCSPELQVVECACTRVCAYVCVRVRVYVRVCVCMYVVT